MSTESAQSSGPGDVQGSNCAESKPSIDPSSISKLRIYPPLGIARVGNAVKQGADTGDEYVIGAEVVGGLPTLLDGSPARYLSDYRTSNGMIKRQAARFRVYAHLRDGNVIEITEAHGVHIEWRVAVANLKAGWYEFNQAMDLPRGLSKDARRRNEGMPIISGGRAALDIVPTPRSIEGCGKAGSAYHFNDGSFCGKLVYLGELRTDVEGRLIVLGGIGLSAPFRPALRPLTFANNVGWHDDVSDGPVRAIVSFDNGIKIEAEPAYVAVTPPNFAPGLIGLVTLDDAVRETFCKQKWINPPDSSSFTRDIWPIFDRLTGLQWVNHGLFIMAGHGSPLNAHDAGVIGRLRSRSTALKPWRDRAFSLFRDPSASGGFVEARLPQNYGDAYGESDSDSLKYLSVTATQYEHLKRWVNGDFDDDWPGQPPVPPEFTQLSAKEQIQQLERASLHDCLGGPFHPGIELTWTMRLGQIWLGAYRLKVLASNGPARQDFGDVLTPESCLAANGPFDGLAAGSLTRFLGVPWQTDSTSCNSAADYEPSTFLSMPTFWGARMPDQVLSKASLERIKAVEEDLLPIQRQKHFSTRVDWLRDVRGFDYYERLFYMIAEWSQLGMVLPVVDPPANFPLDIRVEQGRDPSFAGSDVKRALLAAIESLAHEVPPRMPPTTEESVRMPKRTFRQGEI